MALEQTLSIIKPDGVKRNLVGEILGRFEQKGLRIVATRMLHLSKREAEGFYAVHRERPFFEELTTFMCSGPVVVSVLEGETRLLITVKSWEPPILLKRQKEPSARILLKALGRTRFMGLTVWKTLQSKSPIFSLRPNWSTGRLELDKDNQFTSILRLL